MHALSIQNLQKVYAKDTVLKGINLQLPANEVFGLVGLNGSGKTSLLKCILDLHDLSNGNIEIFSQAHTNKQARQQLVYLPEKFNPPDYMTGRDYLRWILSGHRLEYKAETFTQTIETLLTKVELKKSDIDKPVNAYSKGMTQKLGIIGCLLADKKLLVMDEPMSGLDPKARALFKNIIQEIKQSGKTLIMCSHILSDIKDLCDQVGILHCGELIFTGTPRQCCEQYNTDDFEQAFLNAIV